MNVKLQLILQLEFNIVHVLRQIIILQVTNRYLPISIDPLRFLSTDGPRRTHIADLIESLDVAGIDKVTALSYGQKARVSNYAWLSDLDIGAQSSYGTVVELDLGINTEPIAGHQSSVIVVRDRGSSNWPGTARHFPMFWELTNVGSRLPFGTFRLTGITSDREIRQVVKINRTVSHMVMQLCYYAVRS